MVYSWQLWLSPRPTQRTKFVQQATILAEDQAIRCDFPIHKGRKAISETHYIHKKIVRDGKSGPPLYVILYFTLYSHSFLSQLTSRFSAPRN